MPPVQEQSSQQRPGGECADGPAVVGVPDEARSSLRDFERSSGESPHAAASTAAFGWFAGSTVMLMGSVAPARAEAVGYLCNWNNRFAFRMDRLTEHGTNRGRGSQRFPNFSEHFCRVHGFPPIAD